MGWGFLSIRRVKKARIHVQCHQKSSKMDGPEEMSEIESNAYRFPPAAAPADPPLSHRPAPPPALHHAYRCGLDKECIEALGGNGNATGKKATMLLLALGAVLVLLLSDAKHVYMYVRPRFGCSRFGCSVF
jgi:hypothetical protein